MKINLDWLREFVATEATADELAASLTLAGLEVDGVTPAAGEFQGVLVAEILNRKPHPDADRLSICRIGDGTSEHDIVCGAPNAAVGLKVPFAPVGTILPGNVRIKAAKIRGVQSEGMLCSARELGLTDDSAGLLVLDAEAEVGTDLRKHLRLDDQVFDIDLTPNRGDCFSVLGIAREVAACAGLGPLEESLACVEATSDETGAVELIDTAACPRFAGRVIAGLATTARSPDWLRERLRRAGLRAIHPVVDVTNYVMLEYGQPLHAYRYDKLSGALQVRFARPQEAVTLLDGTELELDRDTLVIADDSGAIGLAGIMGGVSTAVDASTDRIFLESAFFAPAALQGRARRYGLHTDASVRFERGVDPGGQERAIERATALLLDIAGGHAGPTIVAEDEAFIHVNSAVTLRETRVGQLLGMAPGADEIVGLLGQLDMQVEVADGGWSVTPPSYRFDIGVEEDLIEELARMIGYDRIPVIPGAARVRLAEAGEARVTTDTLCDLLAARGYNEVVNFSFTERAEQARMTGVENAVALANPISKDLNVLRCSLWPGLIANAAFNQTHQVERCRLFEVGTTFANVDNEVIEATCVAGLLTGPARPVHWEGASVDADFFDLKADVEALLSVWHADSELRFESQAHQALNPARSAAIFRGEVRVGWIGELHPALQQSAELRHPVLLYEIDLSQLGDSYVPRYEPFSKFPAMRRDLAVVVDERVSVAELTERVANELGAALKRCEIFDIYRGPGVDSGRKSVGMGLILLDASRTLNDEETDDMMRRVMRHLEQELEATIRN